MASPFQGLDFFLGETQGVALGWHIFGPLALHVCHETGYAWFSLWRAVRRIAELGRPARRSARPAANPPRAASRTAFIAAMLTLIFAHAAHAAPLKIELHALAAQPRPEAPEWIDVRFDSASSRLLEGVLELTVVDDGARPFVYRTPELALTTGPRTMRLLLPPPHSARVMDRDVQARLVRKGGDAIELGKFTLHPGRRAERSLVLAVGRTGLRSGEGGAGLWQSLRVERFAPEKPAATMEGFATAPVFIEPDDFFAEPLAYCAFDAVLLEPGAFAAMKQRPRDALGQWLAAGGSVCVFASDPLDAAHIETLRAWLRADPAAPVPEFDADGRVQPLAEGAILARAGLGRLVVVTRAPEGDADARGWRRAAAFLWQFRSAQADAIERDGKWQNAEVPKTNDWQHTSRYVRSHISEGITEALLPKSVRVIPLPLILAILVGFIATVGPVDYFVLGKLRARRFTWVVFPLISVAFTLVTMKLATHFLGTNTHHAALILTDLGADGRALRETRCELILPSRSQELVRDTQRAFAAPVPHDNERGNPGMEFDGQYPARYAFRAPLTQWKPRIVRVSSFGEGADDSGINWDAFQAGSGTPAEWAAAMSGERSDSFAFLIRGEHKVSIAGPLQGELLSHLTFTPAYNTVFARTEPAGIGPLDDLALLEREDAHHAVVIAMRREGSTIHAWRRLYFIP